VSEPAELTPGRNLIRASWAGTALLAVVCALGLAAIDTFAPVVVFVSVGLFAVGCVLFFVAYAIAVGRSRADAIGIGGLYFLAGSAPSPVRRALMASLIVQCAVAVVVLVFAPFTSLVMSSMAPVYGLGCAGVWGARYGSFAPRTSSETRSEHGRD
jgi:hypothetical protein